MFKLFIYVFKGSKIHTMKRKLIITIRVTITQICSSKPYVCEICNIIALPYFIDFGPHNLKSTGDLMFKYCSNVIVFVNKNQEDAPQHCNMYSS